ncbi:MAG TPA: methylamine utilization protein [Sphingomicrobium sp.]|nr:methylamine utilization protein [Sphingomicrobium sp.]
MHFRLMIANIALAAALQFPGWSCAYAAEVVATVTDDAGQPIKDAVVVAVPVDGTMHIPSHPHAQILDQIDKEFVPKVKAIVAGTPIIFPNHDNVRHQVYSFSPAKRFELPLYAGVPAKPVVFDKPGVVVLGCNIHDWMIGYVYVSESPWFATTGTDGTATIADIPPGAYALRVWHPQLNGGEEATRQNLSVSPGQTAAINWKLALRPEVRIRRAPAADHRGHY